MGIDRRRRRSRRYRRWLGRWLGRVADAHAHLLSLILVLVCALGCERKISINAAVCGPLCRELRDPTDYTGMDCAIAARIRLLPALAVNDALPDGGASPLFEQCVSFEATGNSPPMHRLADLFDTGNGTAQPISLGRDPRVPFVVEISLYAPGSRPCQEHQPLVGLGRSGVVDLSRQSGPITVPMGCRSACETHSNVKVQLLALEDMQTNVGAPADLALGEIFPYDVFIATAGLCTAPPLTAYRGAFRSFDLSQSGANLDGVWMVDRSAVDGCTVIAGTSNGGRQFSCLFDENTSKSTLRGFVISAAHWQAVHAFNASVHARLGALVIRVLDPIDQDPNGSAINARVSYALLSSWSEAEYPQDDTWAIAAPTPIGTTSAGLGVAVIADAPSGPYTVTFSDGTTRTINAGGADDPDSVTVLIVSSQR